jgi:hypothetical protein
MFHYINQRQRSWAGIYGKVLNQPIPNNNTDLYVKSLNDNLYIPLSVKSEGEFKSGAGDELSKKMNALYSSSAFVVNTFEYWKQKFENQFIFQTLLPYDKEAARNVANNYIKPLIDALIDLLKLNSLRIINISYEKQNIIYETSTKHPHLDINFECEGFLKDIGFECKYREPFDNIFNGKASSEWDDFSKYYLDTKKPIWNGLDNLKLFANQKESFAYLDTVQLIRHILGLNKKHNYVKDNYLLVYLYCPYYFKDNGNYVDEINKFSNVLKKDTVQFIPITYYDFFEILFQKILANNDINNLNYVNYIIERYL